MMTILIMLIIITIVVCHCRGTCAARAALVHVGCRCVLNGKHRPKCLAIIITIPTTITILLYYCITILLYYYITITTIIIISLSYIPDASLKTMETVIRYYIILDV